MVDTQEILLSLHHVSHYYDNGNIRALNNINLTFKKNHCYSIMGESGSGKSSLLNLISGLDIPSKGEIIFNNQKVSKKEWTKLRARKIGFIFQSFNLLPTLTAIENIIIPMFGVETNYHQRRLKAETLLNYVGLKYRAGHKPNQLSGGERQRVAIARSLINSPELLLADEPTGNLDSNTVDSIMELLLKVQKENKMTLILVTHNKSLAEKMNHIIYLKDGEVIQH